MQRAQVDAQHEIPRLRVVIFGFFQFVYASRIDQNINTAGLLPGFSHHLHDGIVFQQIDMHVEKAAAILFGQITDPAFRLFEVGHDDIRAVFHERLRDGQPQSAAADDQRRSPFQRKHVLKMIHMSKDPPSFIRTPIKPM